VELNQEEEDNEFLYLKKKMPVATKKVEKRDRRTVNEENQAIIFNSINYTFSYNDD